MWTVCSSEGRRRRSRSRSRPRPRRRAGQGDGHRVPQSRARRRPRRRCRCWRRRALPSACASTAAPRIPHVPTAPRRVAVRQRLVERRGRVGERAGSALHSEVPCAVAMLCTFAPQKPVHGSPETSRISRPTPDDRADQAVPAAQRAPAAALRGAGAPRPPAADEQVVAGQRHHDRPAGAQLDDVVAPRPGISSPCSRIATPDSVVSGLSEPSTSAPYGFDVHVAAAPSAVVTEKTVGCGRPRAARSSRRRSASG